MAVINSGQLTAQNEKVMIKSPPGRFSMSIQTSPTNAAGAIMCLVGSNDGGTTVTQIATIDPADGVTINGTLTGVSKFGIAPVNAGAFEHVGVQRTDATGGVCVAYFTLRADR